MSQLIMVIDDEAGVRDLLGDALKLAGFETITAADAMIAQTLLRNTKPDLLIVDINMPLMDGFEFIERIRANGDNTPALMLSARGDRAVAAAPRGRAVRSRRPPAPAPASVPPGRP